MHPTLPLCIFNYTEKTQFSRAWDDITNICRGLIVDFDGKIIARSFDKFHNIEEKRHAVYPDFVIQEKMDGSLGILFYYDDRWQVASRGSFASEQAVKATQMLQDKYTVSGLHVERSYIFEIIYPANRIVVDYQDKNELVYLASFLPNGEEFFEKDLMISNGFPVVKVFDGLSDYEKIKELDWNNAEGFVVRFYDKLDDKSSRCKIKFENYKRLHAVVTNLSVLSVWNWFRSGKQMTDFDAPDEWHAWYLKTWKEFERQERYIMDDISRTFESIKAIHDRGEYARRVMSICPAHSGILFALRDGKKDKVHEMICNKFKPTEKADIASCRPFQSIDDTSHSGNLSAMTDFNKPRIIILTGISASGKSSWARDYVHRHHEAVIISRDSIRALLWGRCDASYQKHPRLSAREQDVSKVQFKLVQQCLDDSKTVIIDDTNLSLSVINSFSKAFANYDISYRKFDIELEFAIQRDLARERTVGSDIIKEQFERLKTLQKTFDFQPRLTKVLPSIPRNEIDPKAYIFDVDGTLSNNVSGRSFYDWNRVGEDKVRVCVKECAIALNERGFRIIICTGRDACCRDLTSSWLKDNDVPFTELHMRPENDLRQDSIVKEELWRDICSRYNVVALFDDRQQVVDHGRRLGLQVFQVAPNMA